MMSRSNIFSVNRLISVNFYIITLLFVVVSNDVLLTVLAATPTMSTTSNAMSKQISTATPNKSAAPLRSKFQIHRLPKDTMPIEYDVHIQTEIHRGQFDFFGFINIRIICNNTTNKIYLNAKYLKNFGVTLIDLKTGENYENLEYETDNHSIMIIYTRVYLQPNMEYLIRISYRGELTDENNGFYKTYYLNKYGAKVWVAATQFEPFYASKAFPCYDEPEFKAKFTLSLTHGTNYTVLSNMRAETVPDENGNVLKTTRFPQTPPMSTYTLAFIVSNYEGILKASNRKLHFIYRMPTSRSLSELIDFNHFDADDSNDREADANVWQFSMNMSIRSVESLNDFFNSYTSIPYALDKIEHISLPNSIGSGHASWGLLTHNAENLFDETVKSSKTLKNYWNEDFRKIRSLLMMNKKLVHQWFGNLVTPKWWNYNWMSEGFSTFYSYIIANETYPEMHIDDFKIFDMVDAGYYLWDEDDLPLTTEVNTESEILATFERSSFYKVANILRMFYYALTPVAFHQGVSTYLKNMEFAAVDEYDLYKNLQMAARNLSIPFFKDDSAVSKSFQTWIHRSGYPIVTVTRKYDTSSFTVQQESNHQEFQNLWWIPMNFVTSVDLNFKDDKIEFILPRIHSATINPAIGKLKLSPTDWLLLNSRQTGYYVVNYDSDNWKLLSRALQDNPAIIHDHNKVQIFRDLNILTDKEIIPIGIVMEMMRFLKRERSLTSWNGATFLIQSLNWKLQGHSTALDFHVYVKELIEPIFKSLDFYEEDDLSYHRYIKYNIFDLACRVNLKECRKMAEIEFNKYLSENLQIQPSYLRRPILCSNLRFASIERFRSVYEKLLTLQSPSERDDLIYALSCAFKIELSEYFIESISMGSQENFTQIEKATAIYYSYFNNKINRETILTILTKNFLKFIRLQSTLLQIFHDKSWYYHASESQRIYRDLKVLNKYLLTNPKDRPSFRVHRKRENLSDKVEEDLLKWLTHYKNKGTYFSTTPKIIHSNFLLIILAFFTVVCNLNLFI